MNLFNRLRIVGPIGLCMITAGAAAYAQTNAPNSQSECAEAPTDQQDQQQQQQQQQQQPQQQDQSAAPQQGPAQEDTPGMSDLVGDALSNVCLNSDQQAKAQQIGESLAGTEKNVADARHAFLNALADQFGKGSIDESALSDKVDAVVEAEQDANPAERKALDDLHGVLDPTQRAAFADAIGSRTKDLAHAAGSWPSDLSKDLNLSQDQQARIKDVVANSQSDTTDAASKAAAVFDAFKGDDFSMDKVAPAADVGGRTRSMVEGIVHLAEQIAPILTPQQRAQISEKMESRVGAQAPEQQGSEQQGAQQQPAPGNSDMSQSGPATTPMQFWGGRGMGWGGRGMGWGGRGWGGRGWGGRGWGWGGRGVGWGGRGVGWGGRGFGWGGRGFYGGGFNRGFYGGIGGFPFGGGFNRGIYW